MIAPYLPQTAVTNAVLDLRQQATELIAPPKPLTQREANRGERSKEFTVESTLRQEQPNRLPSPGAAPRPKLTGKQFTAPGLPEPAPQVVTQPPIDLAKNNSNEIPPGLGMTVPRIAPPQIQAEERPKIAFERPGTDMGSPRDRGMIAIPKPATTVQEAVRSTMTRGGGGVVVGDLDMGESSPMPGLRPSPAGGKPGSQLELLSDPQGADFRPYLRRVLATVRRNWFAVYPESARLGRQGRVVVRFSILRDGRVQQFQFTTQSGTDALDKAAVAGITASQPLPPLPDEFKGGWVRLQLTFLYNLRP